MNNIFIIGAMKCGTTSLFSYLAQHPQICACKEKEPHFFSVDENYNLGFDYYSSLYPVPQKGTLYYLEASPSYTMKNQCPLTAKRIKEYAPNAKLIYLVRDPVKRIESHYAHFATGNKLRPPLSEKIEDIMIEVCRYFWQLEPYLELFGIESIYVVDSSDLMQTPQIVLQKICKFLEIESSFSFPDLSVKHISAWKNTQIYSVVQYLPMKDLLRKVIPPKVINLIQTKAVSISRADVRSENNQITNEQKNEIFRILSEDLKALHKVFGIDVGKWVSVGMKHGH